MRCPYCRQDNDRVVDSRAAEEGAAIRRRRECLACRRRFTTYERSNQDALLVVKKDGRREVFDREKIMRGLLRACEKRPVAHEAIDRLVSEVEREVSERDQREVPAPVIGEAVVRRLRELDQVAYVRFASVYRDFQDVSEFVREARPMLRSRVPARGAKR